MHGTALTVSLVREGASTAVYPRDDSYIRSGAGGAAIRIEISYNLTKTKKLLSRQHCSFTRLSFSRSYRFPASITIILLPVAKCKDLTSSKCWFKIWDSLWIESCSTCQYLSFSANWLSRSCRMSAKLCALLVCRPLIFESRLSSALSSPLIFPPMLFLSPSNFSSRLRNLLVWNSIFVFNILDLISGLVQVVWTLFYHFLLLLFHMDFQGPWQGKVFFYISFQELKLSTVSACTATVEMCYSPWTAQVRSTGIQTKISEQTNY